MDKKKSLIILNIVQIITSIYTMFNAKKIFSSEMEQVKSIPGFSDFIEKLEKIGPNYIFGVAILCIILSIIMIFVILNKNEKEYKSYVTTISILLLLFVSSSIGSLAAIIMFVIALNIKNEKVIKEKKELPKLEKHPVRKLDELLGLILILLFVSDSIWGPYVPDSFVIPAVILNYVILIAFSLFIYRNDLKRDFKAFKENKGVYVKYALKKWGLMLLTMIVCGLILSMLGRESESVNQQLLKELPKYLLFPLAMIEAPIVEETIFRGVVRKFFRNDKVFILVSALLFGLVHVTSEASLIDALFSSITYVLMGGYMAYAYAKTNNMTVNIMMHFFQNTFACLMMLFI